MKKQLLFIDATVNPGTSRTKRLCKFLLDRLPDSYEVCTRRLEEEHLRPLETETLNRRSELGQSRSFEDSMFGLAREFQQADVILIGAPYWDLSFPAMMKTYLEQICINGLTFQYLPDGTPQGLCQAEHLLYLTTAGGYIADRNYGYDYVKALAEFLGVKQVDCIACEGLDIIGNDVEARLQETEHRLSQFHF